MEYFKLIITAKVYEKLCLFIINKLVVYIQDVSIILKHITFIVTFERINKLLNEIVIVICSYFIRRSLIFPNKINNWMIWKYIE